MFYEAYDLFENKKYPESIGLFSKFLENPDDERKKFWSLIFISRLEQIIHGSASYDKLIEAYKIFPERGEILYDLGKFYYEKGDFGNSIKFLERARKSSFKGSCVRYESEKYLEAPLELLSRIYGLTSRYNFKEEIDNELLLRGDASLYDKSAIEYQYAWTKSYNNSALEFLRAKEIKHGERLVIDFPQGYGGLGDTLVFSHIPRIAKESGKFKEVFISSNIQYGTEEYCEFVWGHNPYVDGIVDEPGTYSEIDMRRILTHWHNVLPSLNLLDSIMLLHGLDDGKRGHTPESYYKPNLIEDLSDKTILDPGARSVDASGVNGKKLITLLDLNNIKVDLIIDSSKSKSRIEFPESIKKISPTDIYNWADMIHSSKNYLCFNSGGYWLASSLNVAPIHLGLGVRNIPSWCPFNYRTVEVRDFTIYL